MWSTNSFDGGGFMNNTSNFQSPTSAKKKEQVRRVQSIVPLVTKQITSCPDEEFKLFGMPVQIVNLIGILREFEVQSTKASCTIDDHTGSIKAVLWLESDNDVAASIPPVKEGCYVKVFGSIRNQDGEKIIMILKMFPIDDCNVIYNHLLQVIHTRLAAEKMSQGPLEMPKALPTTSSLSEMGTSVPMVSSDEQKLTKMQNQIFAVMKSLPDPKSEGVQRADILKKFAPHQIKEVNDTLEFLLTEGHIYTTLNSDTFKGTDF